MCEMHEYSVAVPDNMPPCIDSVHLKYTSMHTRAHIQAQTHTTRMKLTQIQIPRCKLVEIFLKNFTERERESARAV